jgi:hypothetical protein
MRKGRFTVSDLIDVVKDAYGAPGYAQGKKPRA